MISATKPLQKSQAGHCPITMKGTWGRYSAKCPRAHSTVANAGALSAPAKATVAA
ncbi:MAG: hypothetical protein WCP14_04135 [bacterium]